MVITWIKITSSPDQNSATFANELLSNFHRWVKSESSLLYDPAIYDQLQNYMKRYFFHLIAEFKRLGAKIIKADFNKIIIDTGKRGLKDAKTYIGYILNKILVNANFKNLEFECNNWWSYLIYLDHNNFLGMCIPNSEELIDNLDETLGNAPSLLVNNAKFVHCCSLVQYLPAKTEMRREFLVMMQEYVTKIHDKLIGKLDAIPSGQTPLVRRRHNETSMMSNSRIEDQENIDPNIANDPKASSETNNPEALINFKKHLINYKLQSNLVTCIENFMRQQRRVKSINELYSGRLPGDKLTKRKDPILDFINSFCKLISLDKTMKDSVGELKNILMRIIGVSAFSNRAEYQSLSETRVIVEIPCESCGMTSDLDICNNLTILKKIESKSQKKIVFFCQHCEEELQTGRIHVELNLLEESKNLANQFYSQDIRCEKCKNISGGYLQTHCKRDGRNYKNTMNLEDFKTRLESLLNIAKVYDFSSLEENVNCMIMTLP